MDVTVIIPNYNHAPYLRQRIDSVLRQTYKGFQLIILDDCSKDNSREIIEEYRMHPQVTSIIYNVENSGSPFVQWQKGISMAQGKFVWIAESDDWCEPTLLQTLIDGVTDNCVLAFSQSLVVNEEDKILWNSRAEFLQVRMNGDAFVRKHMIGKNTVFNSSMAIFRKSCITNFGQDFTSYKFCGDWLFWIEIALQGEVFISGKVLNYFRKHRSDVSGRAYRDGLFYIEYFQLLEHILFRKAITEAEYKTRIKEKFIEFLKDGRVSQTKRAAVIKLFRAKLGLQSYLLTIRIFIYQLRKRAGRFSSHLLL